MSILVVIVTFNSTKVINLTLQALFPQLTEFDSVILIDNGNTEISKNLAHSCQYQYYKTKENLGFCGGNNLGLQIGHWQKYDAILLLNPDLILPKNWINNAKKILQNQNKKIGVISGPLIKYNFSEDKPLPYIDSIGIKQIGFFWQDIQQGSPFDGDINSLIFDEHPEAICGALMLLPREAIQDVMIADNQLFDERYSSYKEDIDLSLRLKKCQKELLLKKELWAYHGRGWSSDRRTVPYHLRLQSARNEILLHWQHKKQLLIISLLKWFYVRFFEKRS